MDMLYEVIHSAFSFPGLAVLRFRKHNKLYTAATILKKL